MQHPFQSVAAVAGHVEAVCDLDSIRCAHASTIGVFTGAVTADQARWLALTKPGAYRPSRAVWQEIHDFAGSDIDQDRAIAVMTAQCEVVDPEHFRAGHRGRWECPDEPNQGHPTHVNGAPLSKARARPATDRQRDILQQTQQGHGPTSPSLN
jgi:hypothetical protein